MNSQTLLITISILLSTATAQASDASIFRSPHLTTVANITDNNEHRSVEKRPIPMFIIPLDQSNGTEPPKHRILIQSGLHGNEKLTSTFSAWLAHRVLNGESSLNKLRHLDLHLEFLPIANPDGARLNLRHNANGVNLNRNFSVLWGLSRENPGKQAFSEPETVAIRDLITTRNYALTIDVHGYINWLVAPSSPEQIGQTVSETQHDAYRSWMQFLQTMTENLPDYQLKTAKELGDGGSFEDWSFWSAGVPSVCLEMFSAQRHVTIEGKVVDTFPLYEEFIVKAIRHALVPKNQQNTASAKWPSIFSRLSEIWP